MKVTLDREREIKVDLNAMAKFAEVTGKELWEMDFKNPKASELRAFLWCSLLRDDPGLKLEDAGRLLDTDNLRDVTRQLLTVASASMPEGKDDGDPNPANGTGSLPGQSGASTSG